MAVSRSNSGNIAAVATGRFGIIYDELRKSKQPNDFGQNINLLRRGSQALMSDQMMTVHFTIWTQKIPRTGPLVLEVPLFSFSDQRTQ